MYREVSLPSAYREVGCRSGRLTLRSSVSRGTPPACYRELAPSGREVGCRGARRKPASFYREAPVPTSHREVSRRCARLRLRASVSGSIPPASYSCSSRIRPPQCEKKACVVVSRSSPSIGVSRSRPPLREIDVAFLCIEKNPARLLSRSIPAVDVSRSRMPLREIEVAFLCIEKNPRQLGIEKYPPVGEK